MLLYILRHGKAEREAPTGRDEDRTLTERGRRQSAWIGAQLMQSPDPPALLISSPATRALETMRPVAEALGMDFLTDQRLLVGEAASKSVAAIEAALQGGAESLLIVGHNPTFSDLLRRLVSDESVDDLRTGEMAVVELDRRAEIVGAGRLVERMRSDE